MIENDLIYRNLLESYGCLENGRIDAIAKKIGLALVNNSLFAISRNPISVKVNLPVVLGITGLSGAGKDTIANQLAIDGRFELVKSYTTRERRERDMGTPYVYISKEEFEGKIRRGKFIEFIQRGKDYMGLERNAVDIVIQKGKIPIIRTGPQAIGKLQGLLPDMSFVSFFVIPQSWRALQKRLVIRDVVNCSLKPKPEARADVRCRLERNRKLLEYIPEANFLLINRDGEIDEAVNNIKTVLNNIDSF